MLFLDAFPLSPCLCEATSMRIVSLAEGMEKGQGLQWEVLHRTEQPNPFVEGPVHVLRWHNDILVLPPLGALGLR